MDAREKRTRSDRIVTKQTTVFCDSCLNEILPVTPSERFQTLVTFSAFGNVGLRYQGAETKHFHNVECLRDFLDEATS